MERVHSREKVVSSFTGRHCKHVACLWSLGFEFFMEIWFNKNEKHGSRRKTSHYYVT